MRRHQTSITASHLRSGLALRALLLVSALIVTVAPAAAQAPGRVRVVTRTSILRWFPALVSDVLATVDSGTDLDVIDEQSGWYWIIAPPDERGTRRPGWIAARDVEAIAVAKHASSLPTIADRGEPVQKAARPSLPQSNLASAPVANTAVTSGPKDDVSIRPKRQEYQFENVHFDRNRYSIRPGETKFLDEAASQLKNDPMLRLNVEGYTCNLGAAAYNVTLGDHRAHAVKDYLVSKGVSGDRLRTVSFGEAHPKHDNSHNATRQLNRRVALVPEVQP
jgi:outer membrane protein OmpA-like peptidoglycan-associated protein